MRKDSWSITFLKKLALSWRKEFWSINAFDKLHIRVEESLHNGFRSQSQIKQFISRNIFRLSLEIFFLASGSKKHPNPETSSVS